MKNTFETQNQSESSAEKLTKLKEELAELFQQKEDIKFNAGLKEGEEPKGDFIFDDIKKRFDTIMQEIETLEAGTEEVEKDSRTPEQVTAGEIVEAQFVNRQLEQAKKNLEIANQKIAEAMEQMASLNPEKDKDQIAGLKGLIDVYKKQSGNFEKAIGSHTGEEKEKVEQAV